MDRKVEDATDVTVPLGVEPTPDGDGDGDDGMPTNLGDIAPGTDSPGSVVTKG
jgi:hypothetical protein